MSSLKKKKKKPKGTHLMQEENISLALCIKGIVPTNKEGWTAVWAKLNYKHPADTYKKLIENLLL